MAVIDEGNTGYLEKEGHRIGILKWCLNDDGSLDLVLPYELFYSDKKESDGTRIFDVTNISSWLNKGTKVVLFNRTNPQETTISEKTKCTSSSTDDRSTSVRFDDISKWAFKPHMNTSKLFK